MVIRYHVIESLGNGGMASVWLGYDGVLDRNVALKVLSYRFADDQEFVERFKTEARLAAALSHPNIASVYDLGETQNGSYYIAMEYVPGGTLKDLINQKGPITPTKAVEIAIQVARALKTAHAYGTIHRDIKPQNILLTEEQEVKVVDFGIAQAAALSKITQEEYILGTEHYMSPEQAKGASVGPQSDLYSLGVVLYEMLTAKLPHEFCSPVPGSTPIEKCLIGYPLPPKKINPLIPKKLSAITVRLLSEDPRHRYLEASTLIADLEVVKRALLRSAATRVLSAAFLKRKILGSGKPKALNSANQQTQTAYKTKTAKTKPYRPSAKSALLAGVVLACLARRIESANGDFPTLIRTVSELVSPNGDASEHARALRANEEILKPLAQTLLVSYQRQRNKEAATREGVTDAAKSSAHLCFETTLRLVRTNYEATFPGC